MSNNDEVTSQALYIQNCSGKKTEKKWVLAEMQRHEEKAQYEDGEFEVSPFSNLQPMELTKNRSDVVEFP